MLRCIAVDDEAFATRLLASYIQKLPGLVLAGTTTNPLEALQWVQEAAPIWCFSTSRCRS